MLRAAIVIGLCLCAGPAFAQSASPDEQELLRLHRELLQAHRSGDVERWLAIESDEYVSGNGGQITHPDRSTRRARRSRYLEATTFEIYRDLREPIVRVSTDGSLGWLLAEVEVRGVTTGDGGDASSFHDIWAWIELYEKVDGRWFLTGNVSNRRG